MAMTYTAETPRYPSTLTQDNSGSAWGFLADAAGPANGRVASVTVPRGEVSNIATSEPGGLGISIAADRRITGVRITLVAKLRSLNIIDPSSWNLIVLLLQQGTPFATVSTAFASVNPFQGLVTVVFGGVTDRAGLTNSQATPANFSGAFQIGFQADATFGSPGQGVFEVDSVSVEVFHVDKSLPFYVCSDPSVGSDSRTQGQALDSETPWLTLAKLITERQSGDNAVAWSGPDPNTSHFREKVLISADTNGSFKARPGFPAPVIRGDTLVTGWAGSAGVFTKNIGTGKTIYAVTLNWDTLIDLSGRRYGHLAPGGGTANSNTFSYNSGTGVLTIGIGASESASSYSINVCTNGGHGLQLLECTGTVVSGFGAWMWCNGSAGNGYGLIANGAVVVGNAFVNCETIDCGFHGIGHVGTSCVNNTIEGCVCWGGAPTFAAGGLSIVFYANVGPVTGCNGSNCVAHAYTLLGRTGDPIDLTLTYGAYFSHCGTPGNVWDLKWTHCTAKHYGRISDNTGNYGGSFMTDDSRPPSDRLNPATYPVRCIECVVIGGSINRGPSSISYERCSLGFSRANIGTAGGVASFGENLGQLSGPSFPVKIGMFGCVGIWNLDDASGANSKSALQAGSSAAGSEIVMINCSFLSSGAGGAGNQFYMFFGPAGKITAKQTIYAFRSTNGTRFLCVGDSALGAANHDVLDCVYWNISTNNWSQNGTYYGDTQWLSGIDPNGIKRSAAPYVGMDGTDMNLVANLKSLKKRVSGAISVGINGMVYDGSYGALQYGNPAGGGTKKRNHISIGLMI